MGVALAGLAVDPLKAVAVNNDAYVNKKLGILFQKPKDWGFVAIKDFGELKAKQKIGEGLDMSNDEIWEELGEPICVATKYPHDTPENKGIFSPTITLNITPKEELEFLGHESFDELIDLSETGASVLLKDFKVLKRYEPVYISNCKFYEFDAEYMFEHVDIVEPLKAELKCLRAEHNGFYYDFNCHQSRAQMQVADKEFEEFKRTIRLI